MAEEYIKREDAIQSVVNHDLLKGEWSRDWAEYMLEDAKPADVAPVVRCKDCIYYQDNNDGYPHDGCRWRSDETPDATDFCSFGERKDNETDRR